MKVTILYFALLRERVGMAREECDLPAAIDTVGGLRDWLAARGAPWTEAFGETARVRAAVDQVMVRNDAALRAGAEVAFFPPVTGG
jgi:molybdopterin synthase sulfur carrier subunit